MRSKIISQTPSLDAATTAGGKGVVTSDTHFGEYGGRYIPETLAAGKPLCACHRAHDAMDTP